MPGSVQIAAPAEVMPWGLCRAFTHSREFAAVENEYKNGEWQRGLLVAISRKRWSIARRLAPDALEELREFYEDRSGPQEPFYFYDPWDTSPKFSYDPTGVATTGRYTVRFDGFWEQTSGMGRADVQVDLVQLA